MFTVLVPSRWFWSDDDDDYDNDDGDDDNDNNNDKKKDNNNDNNDNKNNQIHFFFYIWYKTFIGTIIPHLQRVSGVPYAGFCSFLNFVLPKTRGPDFRSRTPLRLTLTFV